MIYVVTGPEGPRHPILAVLLPKPAVPREDMPESGSRVYCLDADGELVEITTSEPTPDLRTLMLRAEQDSVASGASA
ncbi:hypothetical protein [Actinocorallia sp. A-T 12471]|uniref:hypothetical protein n=1 Tax=Actinocorallia sp. A-T 12471 TaxID=3089813 RepID=UPI0029D0EC4B|nr:hypothetical protein [Actinocorallia sp. A-T 12471]MDX6743612.1 hypothetical protein [Actinocorallia sp. A-T 12471]